MKILIASELRSNRRWYRWIMSQAAQYDYVAIAGDLIDDTRTEQECVEDMAMVETCVEAMEANGMPVWLAEGDADIRLPWPWLKARLGLKLLTEAVIYRQEFGASEEDLSHFGGLAQRLATEREVPFITLSHEAPTSLSPEIAIVGHYGQEGGNDYRWFQRDGGTLELSPGVTNTNRNAPSHIVLDMSHRFATWFSWEGIHRIGLDE